MVCLALLDVNDPCCLPECPEVFGNDTSTAQTSALETWYQTWSSRDELQWQEVLRGLEKRMFLPIPGIKFLPYTVQEGNINPQWQYWQQFSVVEYVSWTFLNVTKNSWKFPWKVWPLTIPWILYELLFLNPSACYFCRLTDRELALWLTHHRSVLLTEQMTVQVSHHHLIISCHFNISTILSDFFDFSSIPLSLINLLPAVTASSLLFPLYLLQNIFFYLSHYLCVSQMRCIWTIMYNL